MRIQRRGRRAQSVREEKNQYGFPVVEFKYVEEWEEEIHFSNVEDIQPKKNSLRKHLRTIVGTILIGLVTNGLYDHMNWIQFAILFLYIKTATKLAAVSDYMASVLARPPCSHHVSHVETTGGYLPSFLL